MIAHKIDLCSDHEIVMANALPKPIPALVTDVDLTLISDMRSAPFACDWTVPVGADQNQPSAPFSMASAGTGV
jgi:hypothetical protein